MILRKRLSDLFILVLLLVGCSVLAQNQLKIGTNANNISGSAVLELESETRGFLPPRMTHSQKTDISSPAAGLIVWCTNCGTNGEMQVYNGVGWINFSSTVPGAPTGAVATAGNTQASVAFTAPASNGGSAITGYTVTSSPSGFTATGASSPLTVTGLTNGTSYTFSVVATNAVGNSVASAASVAVTPRTVPDAPTGAVATASNTQASVAFTAPASNGGSAITGYTVTSSPSGFTATGASSPLTVTGLTNGTSYTFSVIATNAVGNSVASGASAAVLVSTCSANVGGTLKEFLCYNLGVTGTQDPLSYQGGANNGTLYQWGRQTDGHEVRTSTSQAGPVSAPVAGKFITNGSSPNDWRNPQDNTLWLDASKTANDPCPPRFRVPTQAQWGGLFSDGLTSGAPGTATRNTWTWTGNGFTVGSKLYLPAASYRTVLSAALGNVGSDGFYWSSTVNGANAYYLYFTSGNVFPGYSAYRGSGFSVRCISE
ncbi:fibronectin type III domain-containing protein [Flavobacterium sp. GB2R13]|uniref:fibronectin type III domain-containing protein n=1 Tax=Flavobacterium algoris TaxID=3398733 RepID=UPI003A85C9F6